jgi:carbon monoxide dehydrogenase subunit G
MPHLAISKHVDAPPATVWSIVADFANVNWIPVAGVVEVEGEGIGMRRLIHGSGTTPVAETLTSMNADRMELGYSIADNPLPVARFDALVSVRPAGDAATTVTWNVDYDPAGTTEADQTAARDAVEAVYGMMAGWLADASSAREAT